jgi:Domain of unknown function (DUF397)
MRGFERGASEADATQQWRKSSRSYGSAQCIEVAGASLAHIEVRDSKNPQGTILRVPQSEWTVFLGLIRSDKY